MTHRSEQAESVREMSFRLARWDRNRMSQLVARRRKRGMTQADVAKRLGVTKRWVRKFERYDSDPRASEIRMYTIAITAPLMPEEEPT